MSIAEKLTAIAENELKVYKTGQLATLKESRYMNGKEISTTVSANDVSPVEHNLGVKLSSDTVTDFSSVEVTRCGKNLLEYPYVETTLTRNGITFTDNGDGTITANGTATADTQFRLQDKAVYPKNYNPFKYLIGEKVLVMGSPSGSSKDTYGIQSINVGMFGDTGYAIGSENYYRYAIFIKSGMTVENLVFKPVIFLQNVGFSNDFEQYNRQTVTANADGTVEGLTSHSPNMTLFADSNSVTVNCEYYRDIDTYIDNLITDIALTGGN